MIVAGDEPHMPYTRPPLSKELLDGRPAPGAFPCPDLDVEWRLSTRATRLDVASRTVTLGDEPIEFEKLIIATGTRARRWPGETPPNAHVVRDLDDANRLKEALAEAKTVAIVGAGFIGCEVASSARKLGLHVTLYDIAEHPMPALGARAGRALRRAAPRARGGAQARRAGRPRHARGRRDRRRPRGDPEHRVARGLRPHARPRDRLRRVPAGRAARVRRGRRRELAAPAGRRRARPHRALDQRRRAGHRGRPQLPSPTSPSPTRRSRTSGAISTTSRSRPSASPRAPSASSSSSPTSTRASAATASCR